MKKTKKKNLTFNNQVIETVKKIKKFFFSIFNILVSLCMWGGGLSAFFLHLVQRPRSIYKINIILELHYSNGVFYLSPTENILRQIIIRNSQRYYTCIFLNFRHQHGFHLRI